MDMIPNDITHNGPITDTYTSTVVIMVPEYEDSKNDEVLNKELRSSPSIMFSHLLQYGCNRKCDTVSEIITVWNSSLFDDTIKAYPSVPPIAVPVA